MQNVKFRVEFGEEGVGEERERERENGKLNNLGIEINEIS